MEAIGYFGIGLLVLFLLSFVSVLFTDTTEEEKGPRQWGGLE